MAEFDLDDWLEEPQIRTRHRRSAAASPDRLWHAAESVRVSEAATLGRVLRWRIPGTPADLPFRDVFRRYPFTVLDEGELWSISGLCGRVWSLRRDYPRLDGAGDFRDWAEPGTVRVLFAHWVEADRETALVSESRVRAIDRSARWKMRALWASVGGFERLIGGEALNSAVQRAESR